MTTLEVQEPASDDEVVVELLDLPAAIALADQLREQSLGGDTVADRATAEDGEPA